MFLISVLVLFPYVVSELPQLSHIPYTISPSSHSLPTRTLLHFVKKEKQPQLCPSRLVKAGICDGRHLALFLLCTAKLLQPDITMFTPTKKAL